MWSITNILEKRQIVLRGCKVKFLTRQMKNNACQRFLLMNRKIEIISSFFALTKIIRRDGIFQTRDRAETLYVDLIKK